MSTQMLFQRGNGPLYTPVVAKMAPDGAHIHTSRPLSNMSVAFIQRDATMVARKLFRGIPVQQETNSFYVFPKGTFYVDAMQARAPGTKAARIGYTTTKDTYNCTFYSLGHQIPDQNRANVDNPLNLDRTGVNLLTRTALIRQEVHFATTFLTTGVWTTDVTGVAASPTGSQVLQWNDPAATPIQDVTKWSTVCQQLTGFRPNVLAIGREVWDALKDHPTILSRVDAGQTPGKPAEVTREIVARLMELEEIIVGDMLYNTAADGAAVNLDFIVGKVGLLAYRNPNPQPVIEEPSCGYTFNWTGMVGGGATQEGTRIRQYRENETLSDVMEIDAAWDMKKVAGDCGVFFTTLVA